GARAAEGSEARAVRLPVTGPDGRDCHALRQSERHPGCLGSLSGGRLAYERGAEIGHGAAAELTENAVELGGEHVARTPYAALAVGRESIEDRASDHYGVRAQGECFGDIAAPAEAAVDDYRQPVADGSSDFSEHLDGRHTVIELPPAMVGEYDAVATGICGTPRVFDAQNPLDEELPRPVPSHPGDVGPSDRGLEHLRDDGTAPDRTGHPRGQKRFDIAELRDPPAPEHLGEPARMAQRIEDRRQVGLSRLRVIAPVPFPAAKHIGIGSENQRFLARGCGAAHDVLGDRAVPEDVK